MIYHQGNLTKKKEKENYKYVIYFILRLILKINNIIGQEGLSNKA